MTRPPPQFQCWGEKIDPVRGLDPEFKSLRKHNIEIEGGGAGGTQGRAKNVVRCLDRPVVLIPLYLSDLRTPNLGWH